MSTHHFNFLFFFKKARFQLQDGVNTMSTFCAYKLIGQKKTTNIEPTPVSLLSIIPRSIPWPSRIDFIRDMPERREKWKGG